MNEKFLNCVKKENLFSILKMLRYIIWGINPILVHTRRITPANRNILYIFTLNRDSDKEVSNGIYIICVSSIGIRIVGRRDIGH